MPIDVPSFKLIKGHIKELQGVVPNTPWDENDQKCRGQDRVKEFLCSLLFFLENKTHQLNFKGHYYINKRLEVTNAKFLLIQVQ